MDTAAPGGRVNRAAARRGLLLILVALAVDLTFSLIYLGVIESLFREMESGGSVSESMDLVQAVGTAGTAISLLVAIAVAAGAALLGSASRTRRWSYVAIAAAIAGAGLTLVQLGLNLSDGATGPGTLRLFTALDDAFVVVEWLAIGLAVREAFRTAGLSVSGGATATWLAAVAVELLVGLAQTGVLARFLAWDHARLLVYGLACAAVVARVILVAFARRALTGGADADATSSAGGAAALAAGEPSSPAAAGALGLYRTGLILHVAMTALAAVIAMLAGVTGSTPGALLRVVAIPELIAAGLVVVGLFRLGALPSAAIAHLAGVCVLVAVAVQAYAASIVWRVTAYANRAASGSWGGMSLSDVLDLSERLPALELGATVASLVGFLSVAAALHATAGWLGRPALGTRAVAVSVGLSFIALLAGCLRLYLSTARRPALGVAMPLGIAAMVIGLVLFVMYVGLLGKLIERLRGAATALPTARLATEKREPDQASAKRTS